jgi:hypothetical protein
MKGALPVLINLLCPHHVNNFAVFHIRIQMQEANEKQ